MSATMSLIPNYPTNPIPPGKALLTPDQAASYLQIRTQTLANMRSAGRGPKFLRMGRLVRYRLAELDAWIEQTTAAAK